jgi:Uma2 family endonuclease
MSAAPVATPSVEEYLAADRLAERPSEYHDGEIFRLEDVSLNHARLVNNVAAGLMARLRSGPCQILSLMRIRVSPTKYLYPDQTVLCGKAALTDEHQDTVTNPKVIVEVLSRSTEGYGRGRKLDLYRLLPSFEEYVLVAQDQPTVEVIRKSPDGRWIITFYEGLDAVAKVESLDIALPLAELYDGVTL